jgi:hypothetical protein
MNHNAVMLLIWIGVIWVCIYGYELLFVQVKTFLVGAAFVGEVPLYHMILAALITG